MRRAIEKRSYPFRQYFSPIRFHNIRVPVDNEHVSLIVWKMLLRGTYENPEREALVNLLRADDIVLELGTGLGIVSGVAAKSFPQVRFESYEANPAMIGPIKRLHALNDLKNITLHNEILLPEAGTDPVDFHIAGSFAESSMIKGARQNADTVPVPQRDIRDVLATLKPTVMICDIEGAEVNVFQALDLTCLRVLVLELHPTMIDRTAEAAIYDEMARNGLYPRIEHCAGTVVAFERIDA